MPLTQRQWIRLLEEHGWMRVAGGRHVVKMLMAGRRPITLPHHRGATYGRGLDAAIRRQAGL